MKRTSDREIQAILKLDGPARSHHFVKRVVDSEAAWALWSEGWALLANDDETQVFPLWPAREYAELYRTGAWAEYTSEEIDLNRLQGELLPLLAARGILVGLFPTPAGQGVTMKADELAAWLQKVDEENYG